MYADGFDENRRLCINAAVLDGGKYVPDHYIFFPVQADIPKLPAIVEAFHVVAFDRLGTSLIVLRLTIDEPARYYRIIINPKAGKGHAVRIFEKEIKPLLEAAGVHLLHDKSCGSRLHEDDSVYTITPCEGYAHMIANNLNIDHFDTILCIGGDGTLHEVINGLAHRSDCAVAFNVSIATIPAGNVFTKYISDHRIGKCSGDESVWKL